MMEFNTAIIGAGFMGPAHTEALRRIGVNVRGILGVDAQETKKAAEALRIPVSYDNFESVLKDNAVDVIHITTPNKLHYKMAKAALEAGKHVMCEKPLAMTTDETRELVKVAEKSGKVAAVNHNMRFYPLCIQLKEMIKAGDVGDFFAVNWELCPRLAII